MHNKTKLRAPEQVTKAHGTQQITRAQTHSSRTYLKHQTPHYSQHTPDLQTILCFLAPQVELLSTHEELTNLAINTTCFFLSKNNSMRINYDNKYKRQPDVTITTTCTTLSDITSNDKKNNYTN